MKRSIALLAAAALLVAATSALGSGRIPAKISLKLGPTPGLFSGKVKSDNPNCEANRKVRIVIIQGPSVGPDMRVAKGFTNGNGKYSIQTTQTSGTWIAKVKHETLNGVHCKGAQSKRRAAG
jgi:hypothetical protein